MTSSITRPHVPESFICTLPQLGVISLSGEEAVKYLQGQVTANIETLPPQHATLACHCDFKGKTWSIMTVLHHADALMAIMHPQSLQASLAELKKFGVFSKVDIADASAQWQLLGGRGTALEDTLRSLFGDVPGGHMQVRDNSTGSCIQIGNDAPRYLLMLKPDAATAMLEQHSAMQVESEAWEVLEIAEGYPNIQTATSNEYVPQMLNMQALDAIDFKKGCYLGQEVVARTKYLGKNKRAAFLLHAESDQVLPAGDTLESQVGDNWRRAGTVIRASVWQNQLWMLAVLANDTQIGATLRRKEQPELHCSVVPLPYAIDA